MSTGTLRYRALAQALLSLRGTIADERAPIERDVPFRTSRTRGVAPLLDVYGEPKNGASIVLVHGGGFAIGSRRMKPMRLLASRLTDEGFVVAVPDYRLVFRGGRLGEATEDVREAFAFWQSGCAARGLDPDRVSMVGLSAGGTLTLLAASDPRLRVHLIVSCFGLYELDHLVGPVATILPRLVFESADPAHWAARSPRHAPQPTAPTLLLHGTADGLVPVEQARRLAAHRTSLGLPTKLVEHEDAPHGFFNQPCEAATRSIAEIVRHLGASNEGLRSSR